MQFRIIDFYLIKNFLKKNLLLICSFSILIFIVNLIELINKSSQVKNIFFIKLILSLLSVPVIINELAIVIILISSILCFYSLSNKSEITIIRNSGYSLWNLSRPILKTSFCLGILWVLIIQPLAVYSSNLYQKIEFKNFGNNSQNHSIDNNNFEKNQNGIWLRQDNLDNLGEEIIINIKSADKDSLKFYNSSIWFFNREGIFYKKIDSKEIILDEGQLILNDNIINENFKELYEVKNFNFINNNGQKNLNKKIDQLTIKSNLNANFLRKKIINSTQNINSFTIFELPSLISEMEYSGLNSKKFKIKFQSLVNMPLVFLAMTMIACYFGINHIRNNRNYLILFIGIIMGVFLYVINAILISLGSSNLISIFASTWMINLVYLAIGILLVYKKEKN
jgi:lipopolysaccharide export system permease protein